MKNYQEIARDTTETLRAQFRQVALAAWFAARPGQDIILVENEFVEWWASFVLKA